METDYEVVNCTKLTQDCVKFKAY